MYVRQHLVLFLQSTSLQKYNERTLLSIELFKVPDLQEVLTQDYKKHSYLNCAPFFKIKQAQTAQRPLIALKFIYVTYVLAFSFLSLTGL